MITAASFPGDLGTWDQDENPVYLEVLGEAARTLPMPVYADGETRWVPAQNKFIELPLSPRAPGY